MGFRLGLMGLGLGFTGLRFGLMGSGLGLMGFRLRFPEVSKL